jgi:GTPase SAR1 family protein
MSPFVNFSFAMVDKKEIQVFVSYPRDVEKEKDIVDQVCKDLTDSAENYCKISFRVKEWKSIMGQFGDRPQKIINDTIGRYDIYIGIWWMRFGSKPRALNPETGLDFESGTEEEFYIALENWKSVQIPSIHLFFKKPKATSNVADVEQLAKVLNFKDGQMKAGWVNNYPTRIDFQRQIQKLLNEKLLKTCFAASSIERANLEADPDFDLKRLPLIPSLPVQYIARSLINYSESVNYKSKYSRGPTDHLLVNIVDSRKRILLIGDAGSGKSTELIHLATSLRDRNSPYIIIFQKLNLYTPEIGLDSYLPESWKKIPHDLLMILWDGLDEIQPQHFSSVVKQIINFTDKNREARFVISCRKNFYEQGMLTGFDPYLMKDLSIQDAVQYSKSQVSDSDSFIQSAIDSKFDDLLTKPYYLLLLTNIYDHKKSLSKDRAELFEEFLLSRISSDQEHFKGVFDIKGKKYEVFALLERVAVCMEISGKNGNSNTTIFKNILRQGHCPD